MSSGAATKLCNTKFHYLLNDKKALLGATAVAPMAQMIRAEIFIVNLVWLYYCRSVGIYEPLLDGEVMGRSLHWVLTP